MSVFQEVDDSTVFFQSVFRCLNKPASLAHILSRNQTTREMSNLLADSPCEKLLVYLFLKYSNHGPLLSKFFR